MGFLRRLFGGDDVPAWSREDGKKLAVDPPDEFVALLESVLAGSEGE